MKKLRRYRQQFWIDKTETPLSVYYNRNYNIIEWKMMIRWVRIHPIQKVLHSVGKSEYRISAYQKLKIKN